MAISEFKKAVYDSLATPEERQIIDRFYAMSNQDFLKSYRQNMGELVDRFDRTRLWPHQKNNIQYRHTRLGEKTPPKGFITTLPAGAGKTEIFTQAILENAIEVTDEQDKVKFITPPTVILVPSEDLIKQTYTELKEREPNLMVGMDYGKEKNIQPLTITTYETFVSKVEEGKIRPGDIKLMVMDEAHRGLSDMRLNVFKRFLNNTLIDSYSASPAFDAVKNLYELLGEESVIPGPSDRELTDMGFLAECHNILMRVRVNKDDLPDALKNNSERYNDFLEELKIQAAKEFYLNYADEKTGQRAFGKPAVGFARYVRHAQRAADVFEEALREHAANDKNAAKLLSAYTHPTQVLSRSMGDEEVDAAFNRILPKHKRTADTGENLITFTTKMAREGTNVPRWKVALGIQTPNSSVDQVQTRGRARRKTGEELSFVLDTFIEEDGKIRGKPKFYYEAIDDPSIVRGVVTITPEKEVVDEIAADVLEFKDKHEMKALVLGEGDAAKKYGVSFGKLWDEIEAQAKPEEKKKEPKPYMLDGEPVAGKIVIRYPVEENGNGSGDKKQIMIKEFRISAKAIDQFRAALGIPGQINAKWRDEETFKEAAIGRKITDDDEEQRAVPARRISSERAEFYAGKFNALMHRAHTYFEEHKGKKNAEPFMVAGQPIRIEERLDEAGNMVFAIHADAIPAFKQALDIAPLKGLRFMNKQKFEEAVFETAEGDSKSSKMKKHDMLIPQFETMWSRAERDYKRHCKPGVRCKIAFGDGMVEAANCFIGKDKDLDFCLDRSAVAIARRTLGIAPITFDPNTIKWEKDIAAVEQITKIRDNGEFPSVAGRDMLTMQEMATKIKTKELSQPYAALEKEWLKYKPVFNYVENRFIPTQGKATSLRVEVNDRTIEIPFDQCGVFQSGARQAFCVHASQSQKFEKAPEVIDGMLGINKTAELVGIDRLKMSAYFKEAEKEWKKRAPIFDYENLHYNPTKGGEEPIRVNFGHQTIDVPIQKCGVFKSGPQCSFYIHETITAPLKGIIPPATDDMLNIVKMSAQAKSMKVPTIYPTLEAEWRKRNPVFDSKKNCYVVSSGNDSVKVRVENKDYEIPISLCGIYRRGPTPVFCVHKSQSHKFENAPEITPNMLGVRAMRGKAKTDAEELKPVYEALKETWQRHNPVFNYETRSYTVPGKPNESFVINIADKQFRMPIKECGIFRSGGNYSFCIDGSKSALIREMALVFREKNKTLQEKFDGSKRSIKPDSDHIRNRSGRSRGRDEK